MSETFKKLKAQLELQEWPGVYYFKFIAPNDTETVAKVVAHFDEGKDLSYKKSKNGKYISISVKELMLTSDSIIERYEEIAKIKGVIAL